ncbi:MAG: glycoside hydrolase family 36 protein, partial [Anaerolineales bacterium]
MKVQVKSQVLDIISKELQPIKGGFLVVGRDVNVTPTFTAARYYWHGWQSWSLTAWVDSTRRLPPSKPALLHPMQTDPQHAHEETPGGAWVGAIEAPDGRVLLLGALNLDARVSLKNNALKGTYESRYNDEWFVAFGPEHVVFESYAELLAERFGKNRVERPPRVWCSWYSFYTEISETRLLDVLDSLGDLPFDVFQVDDGWQQKIGDWQPNNKFPSGMDALAERIRATGRRAGLWLAPLLVVPSSRTYRKNPHWLLRDEHNRPVSAGYNWNEPLYALDTTHPEVLDWLDELMQQVRDW